MFNTHRTHHGVRHSATHTHASNNPDEITTPADPAWERLVPSSTDISFKAHSQFSGTTASRLSRPRAGFLRSTALLVSALSGPCIAIAQDSSSSAAADVDEVEEVVVSSRTPDLI